MRVSEQLILVFRSRFLFFFSFGVVVLSYCLCELSFEVGDTTASSSDCFRFRRLRCIHMCCDCELCVVFCLIEILLFCDELFMGFVFCLCLRFINVC